VVTTLDDGAPCGFTANSFTSVSLDPPLILVCVGSHLRMSEVLSRTGHFAVNILTAEQRNLSAAFGSPDGSRFSGVTHSPGSTGVPILADVAAWIECTVYDRMVQGDHLVVIGRVVDYAYNAASVLGYCRGNFVDFGLAREALELVQRSVPVVVKTIITHDRSVLLLEVDGGHDLPCASGLGTREDPQSMMGQLASLGVDVEISFVFALYEDRKSGTQTIVYRGETDAAPDSPRARLFGFDAIPWDTLPDEITRGLLRRYLREQAEDLFGVYVGDMDDGIIRPLHNP
jgi:flavin reductase (DIM6/NTAB) family NADH-FMN oxidoreductase RutF